LLAAELFSLMLYNMLPGDSMWNSKVGLKLWSTNKNYVAEAKSLYELEVYSYIELFAVPGSYDEHIQMWKNLNIPCIIHAPHSFMGLNPAKREDRTKNLKLARESQRFADALKAKYIIFHPGIDGDIQETAEQLILIDDARILIENKPYISIDRKFVCNGYLAKDIQYVMQHTNVGFCLDLAHAVYAANSLQEDQLKFIKQFLVLKPTMFHLSDGDKDGEIDVHKNLGKGTFDLRTMLSLIPSDATISLETKKNFQDSLRDFEADVKVLEMYEK